MIDDLKCENEKITNLISVEHLVLSVPSGHGRVAGPRHPIIVIFKSSESMKMPTMSLLFTK
mgnify:CR=1 FL=1